MKKLSLLLLGVFLSTNVFAISEWDKTKPAGTDTVRSYPTATIANNEAVDRLLSNYREGLVLSYASATTISVSAGEVTCSNAAGTVRRFRTNAAATNVTFGDLDTGAEASGTTYYIYAVADADSAAATFKVSASGSAPTGVTYYKRLGSFYNNASSDIDITLVTNDNGVSAGSTSYDSGWFYVARYTGYTKTHNLGSDKLQITVYGSLSSSGSNSFLLSPGRLRHNDGDSANSVCVYGTTSTQLTVYGGNYPAYWFTSSEGNFNNYEYVYVRVIATVVK